MLGVVCDSVLSTELIYTKGVIRRTTTMKLSTALFTSALAIGLVSGFTAVPTGTAQAAEVKGKIESTKKEGREITIGGMKYFISGSRTNVCIKGTCDADRADLKVGMSCKGNTSGKKKGMEFKKVSCK